MNEILKKILAVTATSYGLKGGDDEENTTQVALPVREEDLETA